MMKTLKIFTAIIALPLLFTACKQSDFLDLKPKDQLTVENTFISYDSFKTYGWQFYDAFPGYSTAAQERDIHSDLLERASPNGESPWIWQRITVPSSTGEYTQPYARIRSVNIMLDQIDKSKMNEADRNHWRSVGYFFRAYNYADLINLYGDVPYVDRALTDGEIEELFSERTSRDIVAQHILDDLQYAVANIKVGGDGPNTINKNVVRALISRFGLREGTWRKYHGLADADKYLTASATASAELMTALPVLNSSYDADFNSESLAGSPGIILYKQYATNQITHGLSTMNRNSSGRYDLTKKAADLFLMTDGQTRFTSSLFEGDKTPYTEFRNRDQRLYFSVPPPYKVKTVTPSLNYTFTDNPADREYFAVMSSISDDQHKALPSRNWNTYVVIQEPHFVDYPMGQPFNVTYTGYRFYKFYNRLSDLTQGMDISDAPVFRMGEVLLNYAEAKFELGSFDQSVADATVNKLRARGKVAPLNVANIPTDPTRDAAVTPLLWEIRRERAVELLGEGFRFDDLRRWKKMAYATERKLGRWIKKGTDVPANSPIPILNGATEGYIAYEGQPPASFPDYYYLYPIPSNQIAINPKYVQNPGWK